MKLLLPFAWLYGGIMAFRNWLFDHGQLSQTAFDLPVISVGNLAVGGTGKTPHTEYLLKMLREQGWHCAMLSRGYGRKTKGFYQAKGNGPQVVGDEPWQVQQKFPEANVYVCEKRVEGIQQILKQPTVPEVILLDDAYQHRYVKPGLSILLTDYSRPYFSDEVMPAGRLREFRKGYQRADLIVVTKCPEQLSDEVQRTIRRQLAPLPHQTVFFTCFQYGKRYPFQEKTVSAEHPNDLRQSRILLLCGIARPQQLLEYLRPLCKEVELAKFPDHHNFSPSEINQLVERSTHFDLVVTTEKDAARLSGYTLPQEFRQRLWVQPIEVHFLNHENNKFNKIISDYVTENTRNSKLD